MPIFEIGRDNPLGDLLHGGKHPFPPRIEELVRLIAAIDEEQLLPFLGSAYDWEALRQIERGEKELHERLVMLWKKDS